MEAIVISREGKPIYERSALADPKPGPGEVLLRMHAAALNYRDLLIRGQPVSSYGGDMRGRIALSDGVGTVVETGPGVSRFKTGDRVCPIFFPGWLKGDPSQEKLAVALGSAAGGGTGAETMIVSEDAAVLAPPHLGNAEAASLACAGVTAWVCLMEYGRAQTGETVLVQGTGGVSLFTLQFARALGMKVILISSDDEKLERGRRLGADLTLNYKRTPAWGQAVLDMTDGIGVKHIIDVGGELTLPQSSVAAAWGGHISMVGILSGFKHELSLQAVNSKMLHAHGVYVGSRESFEQMNEFISHHGIRPVIDKSYRMDEANEAIEDLGAGRHFGKIAIEL
jgi:NADPH:quinone reductase-like Zn-dependent oxidoreductase